MSNLFPLPFKRTQPVYDFATCLISYINQHSSTTHPDTIRSDAHQLEKLRNKIYGSDGTPVLLESTVDNLILYQAQLCYTLTKFPETAGPSFTYHPLFSSSSSSSSLPPGALPFAPSSSSQNPPTTLPFLSYDLLSSLLNLASLYVSLAFNTRQPTQESLKSSIQYYSLATGVYQRILSLLPRFKKLIDGKTSDGDLDEGRIKSLEEFTKGLSQECGWLKSVMDRLKNGTISKLALQVSEYYQSALQYAEQTSTPFPEEYVPYLRLKTSHFKAVSQYRRSLDDLGSNRYGDELGRLTLCRDLLKNSLNSVSSSKPSKGSLLSELVKDSKSLLKTIEENLVRANKDNDLIYLSHPTPPSSLPLITPFSISKPTLQLSVQNPLKWVLEQQHEEARKLFGGMERREVGMVSEIWEDRKKGWVREEVRGWVKDREGEERKLLKDLNLPSTLDQLQQSTSSSSTTSTKSHTLPQSLIDQSAEINRLGGTEKLETLFKDVSRISSMNSKLLSEANEHLHQERITNEFYLTTHGSSWNRSSSTPISHSLSERITHLSSLLQTAQSSDQLIRQKYSSVLERLKLLVSDQTELRRVLPPLEVRENLKPVSMDLKRVERRLRGLLEDLKDLEQSREEVVRRIESISGQWEIRPSIVQKSDELALLEENGDGMEEGEGGLELYEEVLERGLKGLRDGSGWGFERKELERRGEEILDAIRSANSTFTSLVKEQQPSSSTDSTSNAPSPRSDFLASMSEAHSRYLEMLGNLEEGLKFYSDLSRLATELREACKNFAYSRNLEAQKLDARLAAPPPSAPSPEPEARPGPVEQEEEEEDSPIEEEDPVSAAFSQPLQIPTTTPRRSSRRTQATESPAPPSSTRQTRKLPSKSTASSSTPRRTRAESRVKETEKVEETVQGGWDPSMGIRFG